MIPVGLHKISNKLVELVTFTKVKGVRSPGLRSQNERCMIKWVD